MSFHRCTQQIFEYNLKNTSILKVFSEQKKKKLPKRLNI